MKNFHNTAHPRRESGFTLIELLTVIVVIGILAAIAVPVFSAQRARAQDAVAISEARSTVTGIETLIAGTPGGTLATVPTDFVAQVISNGSTAKTGDTLRTKVGFGNGKYYVSTQNTAGKATSCVTSTSPTTGDPVISGAGCTTVATYKQSGTVGELSAQTFTVAQTTSDVIAMDAQNVTVTP